MVKKSLLKRASYFGSALVLMLAAVPIVPTGRAWADALDLASCLASTATTCTLQGDEVMDSLFTLDRDLTIELNGHKISSSNTAKFFEVKGYTLNIVGPGSIVTTNTTNTGIIRVYGTDTVASGSTKVTVGQNVTLSGPNPVVVYNNNGTAYNTQVDIYGTLNGQNSGIWMIGTIADKTNYPVVNIHDGAVISANNTDSTAVSAMGYAQWNIGNATITGTGSGIGIKAGIVNANGATVKGTGNPGVLPPATYDNGINPSGAAIQIEKNAGYPGGIELNIESGTFTSDYNEAIYTYGTASSVNSIVISGGTFSSPEMMLDDVASGKAVWKTGYDKYEVLDASDANVVNGWMLAKVGVATPVANMSERVKNYSDFKVVGNGTFENGAYTPAEAGKYDYIRVFPRVCKDEGGNVTCGKNAAENNYEATIRIDTYGINEINEVLPVGSESQIPDDAVIVKDGHMSYTYSVEDSSVATVDADGKITAVKSGTTKVYATINGQGNTSVQEEIGTVYVYDFNSISDNYLIKKNKTTEVLTDSNWDVNATTGDTSVVKLTEGTNSWKVKGLSAGMATVTFSATIGGEEKTKTSTAHVYDVVKKDVVVKKGETVSADELAEMVLTDDGVTPSVKKIADTGIASTDNVTITGVEAGQTTATYRLSTGTAPEIHASVSLNVHVWDFVTENLVDVYDLGDLQTTTDAFRVYDNGGEISYTVKDESGAEADDVVVTLNGDEYTITKADGARAGEYLVKFTDTVMGEEVASKTIAVRVHEIEIPGDAERYVVMGHGMFANNSVEIGLVREENHYSRTRDLRYTVTGTPVGGAIVSSHYGGFTLRVNQAGSYTVTFDDGIASASINVYVIDFTFGQDSYHVRREDGNAGELINAINNYWHEENVASGYTDTEFVVVNDETGAEVASGYGVSKTLAPLPPEGEEYKFNWCLNDECLPAGNYTITFRAYANEGQGQTTKSVRLHIYEMVAPQEDLYFMETGDSLTIDVDDMNDRASTRAEIVSGPEGGLSFATTGFWFFTQTDYSRLNASLPGVYTVRYTDYMGNGAVVGTYEATIVVVEVEYETLLVRSGKTVEITGSEAWAASHATDVVSGEDYEVENGVIKYDTTGMELGERWVTVAHDFTEFDEGEFPPREMVKVVTVVVYDVTGDETDDMTSDADRDSVADLVAGHIETMIKNDSLDDEQIWWSFDDIDELKELLSDGAEITTRLEVRLMDEDEWEYAEAYDKVVLKIEDESGVVAMYEVYLEIYADGAWIGTIYELDDEITMRLEIPEEYRTAADGYTRTFTVVRGHLAMDGTETAEVMDVTRDGNYLVFKNKKFSSFAISYTDNLIPVAPDTGFVASEGGSASASSNLVAAVVTVLGAIALAGAAIFAKRY